MASGLTVGKLSAKTGVSRKALRVYEAAGILTPATRTPAGYRVYHTDAVDGVAFIARARRLGFSVAEIRQIVGLRRAGQAPCVHVQRLAREEDRRARRDAPRPACDAPWARRVGRAAS